MSQSGNQPKKQNKKPPFWFRLLNTPTAAILSWVAALAALSLHVPWHTIDSIFQNPPPSKSWRHYQIDCVQFLDDVPYFWIKKHLIYKVIEITDKSATLCAVNAIQLNDRPCSVMKQMPWIYLKISTSYLENNAQIKECPVLF